MGKKYYLTLKDKGLMRPLKFEIIQDKKAGKYYIMDINKQLHEIESFLDGSLITYPHNLDTLLENIFLQHQEQIQDFLNRLFFDLNESLEQNRIAF